MMPGDMVTVRVDLEAVKQSMLHAFSLRAGELAALIESEADNAIKTFDWKGEVATIAAAVIRDVVRNQIQSAMSNLRWDEPLRRELTKAVLRELVGANSAGSGPPPEG